MPKPNETLKVLHITFDMGLGGTEQVIRQLVTENKQAQIENTILCIDGKVGPLGEMLAEQGVSVLQYQRAPGFDQHLISHIRSLVKEQRFHIVHCHQYTPYLYGFLGGFFTGAKIVFTEHGRFHPDRHRYKALIINPVMALMTSAVVAISKATKSALAQYEFIPRFKTNVIYNGIQGLSKDPGMTAELREQLNIREDQYVVGTVARLDPVKNQPMMMNAFKLFLQHKPNAVLLMVGDGPDRDKLEALAKTLSIEEQVIFTGFISKPVHHLALMDLFLLSSHTEGTSMTLLEAMSLGIPTVATAVGGNPEIVEEGKTGFLTPADDAQGFCDGMVKIASNPELAEAMSKCSQQRFESQFSVAQMSKCYVELYRGVV